MKRLSLDNGATFIDVESLQQIVDYWDRIIDAMDDEIRERVHQESIHWDWSDLEFLLCYLDNAPEDLIIG